MILYLFPDFPFSIRKLLHNLTIETQFGKMNQCVCICVCACVTVFQKKNSVIPSLEH